jgi:predicted lactoylglutathione lyase
MTNELWMNLPVKDLKKSKEFFTKIGFSFNTRGESNHSAGLVIGTKNIVVMLFEEAVFKGFTQNNLTDTEQATEVLFSFDAESREEVDAMAVKVKAAGGIVFSEPAENQGWMYGFAFVDLDGHRWNMLYMDMSKMAKR